MLLTFFLRVLKDKGGLLGRSLCVRVGNFKSIVLIRHRETYFSLGAFGSQNDW